MQKYKFSAKINKELLELQLSDNYHWIYGLSYDYLIILSAIFLSVSISWYFYLFSILIIGSRMRAIATLLHDATHLRLCRNRYLNNFVGKYLLGILIFQGFDSYVQSHVVKHHLFLGDENQDPDYNILFIKWIIYQSFKINFYKKIYITSTINVEYVIICKILIKK